MRTVHVPEALADGLGQLQALERERQGVVTRCREYVRGRDIEELEQKFEIEIPDAILAYLAAGVSAWGDGPVGLRDIDERTQAVRETAEESGVPQAARDFLVIDDDSKGNFIAIRPGQARSSDRVYFLDHEKSWAAEGEGVSLIEHINQFVAAAPPAAFTPFSVVAGDDPSAHVSATWVSHARFGRGRVIKRLGENVIVAFEEHGEKRLKREYVRFE